MKRPSPALVVALIALFVALGGTSYAAIHLPKNSVGTKQLKKGAVTGKKIKNHTIAEKKLTEETLATLKGATGPQGPAGPQGPTGATGAPGSALAYAEVTGNGALVAGTAKNIEQSNISSPSTGVICFSGLGFTPLNVQATREGSATTPGTANYIMGVSSGCPAGTEVTVVLRLWNGSTFVASANHVMVAFN